MTKAATHLFDLRIGQQIRTRRKLIGMSQSTLGKRAGITFQQIQKYERGVNSISAWRLHQFAEILEIPASYFYDSYSVSQNDRFPFIFSEQAQRLLMSFNRIACEHVRNSVANFVHALSKNTAG